jgi:hypothetical protein
VLALAGFAYIVVSRPNFHREVILAAVVATAGTLVFVLRSAGASGKGVGSVH